MLSKKVIILGNSGHGFVMLDTAYELGLEVIGYAQNQAATNNPFGLQYLGSENDPNFEGWSMETEFIIGIGDNKIREKIFKELIIKSETVTTLLHPTASISKHASIGAGTFVNRNASVNAFAIIGENVIVNTAAVIEHDCVINNSVHIAPGAVLAGNVEVGERSFIGANATVKQGVKIGKDVVIGAGSVVLKNIPDNAKVAGNPAKEIK